MRAMDITTDKVRKYMAGRQEAGYSNAEINRELAALKRMFNLARQQSPPKVDHVPYIPMLPEDNVRKGFFEPEAFRAVLKELPEPLKPVATFAYYTSWRKEKILNLTWGQVDLDGGIVRLEPGTTKNREGRTVFLPTELDTPLRQQWAKTNTLERQRGQIIPWVFHRSGKPIRDFRDVWNSACQRAGYPGRLFHDFRRTGVRNMVRAGVPERVTMQISGHKTRSVFDRYNIVSEGDLREAARKLSGTISGMGTISGTIH
jgi:integrase